MRHLLLHKGTENESLRVFLGSRGQATQDASVKLTSSFVGEMESGIKDPTTSKKVSDSFLAAERVRCLYIAPGQRGPIRVGTAAVHLLNHRIAALATRRCMEPTKNQEAEMAQLQSRWRQRPTQDQGPRRQWIFSTCNSKGKPAVMTHEKEQSMYSSQNALEELARN